LWIELQDEDILDFREFLIQRGDLHGLRRSTLNIAHPVAPVVLPLV
jgi:hypothetical protein